MKKLTTLLTQRPQLLRQVRLANLAFAHATLADVHRRFVRARLGGRLLFQSTDPENERYCPTLTALDASQSVIEEHFTDESLLELADVLDFVTGQDPLEITFHVDEFAGKFLAPVRAELERSGVEIDPMDSACDAVGPDGNEPDSTV